MEASETSSADLAAFFCLNKETVLLVNFRSTMQVILSSIFELVVSMLFSVVEQFSCQVPRPLSDYTGIRFRACNSPFSILRIGRHFKSHGIFRCRAKFCTAGIFPF